MNDPHVAPFSEAEYSARLTAVRDRMAALGLDALLLTRPEDVYYLAGLNHQGYFAPTVLVVPSSGQLLLVARAMEATTIAIQAPGCRHVPFHDYEEPADAVVRALRELSERPGRVGVDKDGMWLPVAIGERLLAELPETWFENASELVAGCREVKSDAEVSYLRKAAELSSAGMQAAIATIGAGVKIRDVAQAIFATMVDGGSEQPAFLPLLRFRDALLLEHTTVSWSDRTIERGDAIFIELSGSVERYHAPMSRMIYVGDPPGGTDVAAGIAAAGLDAVRDALVPGVRAGEVYAAWQTVVDEALGHGRYRRHHCGYMVGVGFPPTWTGGPSPVGLRGDSEWLIRPGMTFHTFSWLLGQRPADYVLSDTVVLTSRGAETVTAAPREPVVVS